MKRYTTLYYFLFLLLITGAFASMAQNAYGVMLCGIACLGFAVMFMYEIFFGSPSSDEKISRWISYLELVSLAGVSLLFMLRNFSIDSYLVNLLMSLLLLILLILTTYQAIGQIRKAWLLKTSFTLPLLVYYAAIIVFFILLLTGSMLPQFENTFAFVGIILFISFLVVGFVSKKSIVAEEATSVWKYIGLSKNKSAILLTTGMLLVLFNLSVSTRTLPPLYRADMPEGYQHLVDETVTKEDAEKAQEFKSRYDLFVQKWKP